MVGNESVESVSEFSYLGSTRTTSGRSTTELQRRIAKASRVFGAVKVGMFGNKSLSIPTKCRVY